jgi:hydrogenase maturation protein HypF
MLKRARGTITGIVQGVGFRPFLFRLASRHGLAGFAINTAQGVEVEVEGREEALLAFRDAILPERPPLARIASMEWSEVPLRHEALFRILESDPGSERTTLISPDVCVCEDCLAEMRDPRDRRHRYPFINCTNCGPRYTIIQDVPYDRPFTTMKAFEMCPVCRKEYEDPHDRRFHAQPNACPRCGPSVALHDGRGMRIDCADPIREAVNLLSKGHILAVKGLGGFHLAVDAGNHQAVVRLRKRKHREEKPLAVMVKDLAGARELVHVSDAEAALLTSMERPIVLLEKRQGRRLSPQVAPRNRCLGVMLPYTPLHHLLMEGPYPALVMTSGNRTEEPINIDNTAAFESLSDIADYFLVHNRDIYLRSDDSVMRVVDGIPRQIRRSRGYVPVPLFLSEDLRGLPQTLAVGGELKATICLTKENRAFLSQHIGDMENLETLDFFHLTVSHLKRILEVEPRVLAHDLHPDYLSSRYAREQNEIPTIPVQHHHGHIVACLAEHGLKGPVIGLAMDGTGYGADGRIWGGEVLLADAVSFRRAGHLEYVPLPGGDAAAKNPWRMGLMYLRHAFGDALWDLPIPFVRGIHRKQAELVLRMADGGIHTPFTSSCGRLFDAVSSLLRIRDRNAYEGQAAIELEMAQRRSGSGSYACELKREGDTWILGTASLIRGIVSDILSGVPRGLISRRFHQSLILLLTEVCERVREESGLGAVALSGGSFQNATLLRGLTRSLGERGFSVYSHALVPTNDGCLALGQAVSSGLRFAGMKGEYD